MKYPLICAPVKLATYFRGRNKTVLVIARSASAVVSGRPPNTSVPSQKFATLFEPASHCEEPKGRRSDLAQVQLYGPRLLRFARNDEDHIYTTNFRTGTLDRRLQNRGRADPSLGAVLPHPIQARHQSTPIDLAGNSCVRTVERSSRDWRGATVRRLDSIPYFAWQPVSRDRPVADQFPSAALAPFTLAAALAGLDRIKSAECPRGRWALPLLLLRRRLPDRAPPVIPGRHSSRHVSPPEQR
jgi:hypothetical protein